MEDIETQSAADGSSSNEVPAAVEQAFNNVFSNTAREQEQTDELVQEGLQTPDGNSPAEEQTIRPVSSEGADEGDPNEAVENDEAGKEGAAAEGQKAPLDPYLRFVGVNSGLTNETIDKLFAADPETATATLSTLAESFNNLSRQYLVQPGSPVAPGTQAPEQQPAQTPTPGFDKFMSGLAAFTEANGEDIGTFAKLVNDELVGPLKQMIAANQVREADLTRQEAVSGFEAVRKDFSDFYGPDNGTLTPGQQNARAQVAQIADQIRAGGKAQGRVVSIKDAIAKAHSIVTHDMRQQAARKEIAGQVQKRAALVTAKPTQRKTRPTGERSDAAATAAAKQKMIELGFDNF